MAQVLSRVLSRGLLSGVCLGPVRSLSAQVAIPDSPACPGCVISAKMIALLGDTSGGGELSYNLQFVRRDSRGRYVVSLVSGDLPAVFTASGQFAGTLGLKGRGPGEFIHGLVASVDRDTAWIIDHLNARVTALPLGAQEPPKTYTSTTVIVPPYAVIRTRDGAVVFNASLFSADRIGYPLHRMIFVGDQAAVTSFGTETREYLPAMSRQLLRVLSASQTGGFWDGHLTRYRIERYAEDATLAGVWSRDPAWFFPQSGNQPPPSPDRPPAPLMGAIQEDGAGRLWVFVLIPDMAFKGGFSAPRTPAHRGEAIWLVEDLDRYFDTQVDVLDVKSGRLVISQRFDQLLGFAVAPEPRGVLMAGERKTAEGRFQAVVWRMELHGETRRQ